jgi:hypothetical protein
LEELKADMKKAKLGERHVSPNKVRANEGFLEIFRFFE